MIHIVRAYDHTTAMGGRRFYIDRLWPRGIKKEALQVERWIKEVAPSDELRHWYQHDPQKWEEFKRRYFSELEQNPAAWKPLLEAARQGDITLVYSATEERYNNAAALKIFLEARL